MSTLSLNTPAVSVLIRSMDRDHLISALVSANAQDYAPLHIVVVNASGQPHRPLPNLKVSCELIDPGVQLARPDAANMCLQAVQTPLALFLDDDDLIDPHHIRRLVEALNDYPAAPAAYGGVRLESSGGELLTSMDSPWVPGELLVHNTLPIHAVLFRMDAVQAGSCQFDKRFSHLEDWDFWLQLSQQGDFIHVPGNSATYCMALGNSGLSQQRDIATYQDARSAVWGKWLPKVNSDHLAKGLASLIDRLEQLEWDTEQLHASEAKLHQQNHERLGQLQELREHYEKLQELHSSLHKEHSAIWERFNALQREHKRYIEPEPIASDAGKKHQTPQQEHSSLQQEYAALKQAHVNTLNRLNTLQNEVNALLNSRSMRMTAPLRWIINKLRQMRSDFSGRSLLSATKAASSAQLPIASAKQKQPAGPVDIIVPVYKGLEETRACLESVWASEPSHAYRLIVINDASPEAALTEWLREASKARPMVLLENEQNLGFVGTVNRGMAYSHNADVVLLNSDAEVANDWLDRLIKAAYLPTTRPAASVTPFSNNATICSYPRFCEDNLLIEGYTLPELDQLFAQTNAGQTVEIPTGIGFCMYIRREALDAVGLFDEDNFGKGYGEENDFCMRTLKAGWCHLHALDVFAWHKGSVSFGDSQPERVTNALEVLHTLHPDYEARVHQFIQQDPAQQARLAIDVARLRNSTKPRVLMINHQRGGGTERHCRELADTLVNEVEWLMLRPSPVGGARLSLLDEAEAMTLDYVLPDAFDEMVEMLKALGVVRVHVHHWLGFNDSILELAKRLGVPQDVTLHDYYSVCPQISLTRDDNRYCGEEGIQQCQRCLAQQPAPDGSSITEWRERHAEWLLASDRVITPSQDTSARIKRYIPNLDIKVAVHPDQENDTYPPPAWQPPEMHEPLRVAVIGALSAIKGADVLEDVAAQAAKLGLSVEFRLFGFAYRAFKPLKNLSVTGAYQDDKLPTLLNEWRPHIAWFPPLWPETYSYTLSTCLALGLPIVATNIGALPERLNARPHSWLLEWDSTPNQWCHWFSSFAQRPECAVGSTAAEHTSWPTIPTPFYAQQYAVDIDAAIPNNKLPSLPSQWQAHASHPDTKAMRARKALVSMLYWLRAQPFLRELSRHVPAGLQRKVKSRLLKES